MPGNSAHYTLSLGSQLVHTSPWTLDYRYTIYAGRLGKVAKDLLESKQVRMAFCWTGIFPKHVEIT